MGGTQGGAGAIEQLFRWLGAIFSPLLLAAVGIIVSGKLITARFSLTMPGDDKFAINVGMLNLRAVGPAVPIGLGLFILSLGTSVIFGGKAWYLYFREQAGIDVGHWNSLVAISSFLCIVASFMIYILAPLFMQGSPVVSDEERAAVLRAISKRGQP